MYCTVICGQNDNRNYTKLYLCRVPFGISVYSGITVFVRVMDKRELALVHSVYDRMPDLMDISEEKIKDISGLNDEPVDTKFAYNVILALIDEYIDGNISKEEFYGITESFVSNNTISYATDDNLRLVLNDWIPDACTFYIDEPGDSEEKEQGFLKILKECENLLRYGEAYNEGKSKI